MKTSFLARRAHASVALLGVAFLALPAAGCFKAPPDTSQLKCTTQAGCPANYYCSAAEQKCHLGTADGSAEPVEGGAGGASADGQGNPGGARDGASPSEGTGGSPVVADGGPGGGGQGGSGGLGLGGGGGSANGGASSGALPGSGGISPADAPSGAGGMAPDAPLASGGTGSPDAPLSDNAPAQLANGASCSSASRCTSANCVDGVCCNAPCDGQCQSCNQAGSPGQCVVIKELLSPRGPPAPARVPARGSATGAGKSVPLIAPRSVAPELFARGAHQQVNMRWSGQLSGPDHHHLHRQPMHNRRHRLLDLHRQYLGDDLLGWPLRTDR